MDRRQLLGGLAGAAGMAAPGVCRAQPSPIETLLRDADYSGAVLAVRNGRIVARMALGYASHEHGVRNTPETRFKIASISKTMTAGAVLTLVQKGRITLDDPLSRHLADTPPEWSDIRIRHLLNHSSGVLDVLRRPGALERLGQRTTLAETVESLQRFPLDFPTGSNVRYGNSGSIIAALVVERLTGRPFPDVLRDDLYIPLGMTGSGFADSAALIPRLADGYRRENGALRRAAFIDMTVPMGAGAEYSTVDDLHRWIMALESGPLAPTARAAGMFEAGPGPYGLAWQIGDLDGRRTVAHVGDINGFGSYLLRLPQDDVTVVVLSNMERTPVRDLAQGVARSLLV